MSAGFLIGSLATIVLALLVVTIVLFETSVVIQPGTIGLVIRRGRAAGRGLEPGRHFLRPAREQTVQIYPSRQLAVLAGATEQSNPDVDYVEQPVVVHLRDRSIGRVSYTVRCKLDRTKLQEVHDSFGPEGIWSILRDESRQCVIAETVASGVTAQDVFGEGYARLEQRIDEAMRTTLAGIGFELTLFSLREIDLGETGEVIQATARAVVDAELEQALATVRRARVDNDAALVGEIDGLDHVQLLQYRKLEVWYELVQRWNGTGPLTPAAAASLLAAPLRPEQLLLADETGGEGA